MAALAIARTMRYARLAKKKCLTGEKNRCIDLITELASYGFAGWLG